MGNLFFFSSRRRHTRSLRDWSSDVCSSDLLEANPDDITPESLEMWRSAGINRLSIGLQSFDDRELRWMNRAHTADQSLRSEERRVGKECRSWWSPYQ